MASKTRIFFVLALLLIGKVANAQVLELGDTVSVEIRQGSLIDALHEISDLTGLRFGYRNKLLIGKVTEGGYYNGTVDGLLQKVVTNNKLCYSPQGHQIIIHDACITRTYTISGSILEANSYKALPYISVSLPGKPIGVIADKNGYFELQLDFGTQKNDTIIFSSLGYKRDTQIVRSGNDIELTVFMHTKTYEVPPVHVRPTEYVAQGLGNKKDRAAGSLYLDTHGQQTALYVANERDLEGIVESVSYFLTKEGNTQTPFRVRIYDVDTRGFPGKDIITDAVVVRPAKEEGWYTVDLSMLQIEIPPKGMFIAIEGVFPDEYEKYYGSSDFIELSDPDQNSRHSLSYGQRIGYNRKCKNETWHYSISKVWFQLEKQSFGVMIKANVKYEKAKNTSNDG